MADIQPNIKTSQEAAAGALATTDLIRIVQGLGTTPSPYGNFKLSMGALATYIAALVTGSAADPTKVAIHNGVAANYTYIPDDAGKVVRHTSASPTTVTVAPNATQAFAATQVVTSRQVGAGQLTIQAGAGVTINVPTGTLATTRAQGSVIMLHYVGTDVWDLTGDLTTV